MKHNFLPLLLGGVENGLIICNVKSVCQSTVQTDNLPSDYLIAFVIYFEFAIY